MGLPFAADSYPSPVKLITQQNRQIYENTSLLARSDPTSSSLSSLTAFLSMLTFKDGLCEPVLARCHLMVLACKRGSHSDPFAQHSSLPARHLKHNGGPRCASLRTGAADKQCAVTSRHPKASRAWQRPLVRCVAPAEAMQQRVEQGDRSVSKEAGREGCAARGGRFDVRERLWLSW